MSLYNESIELYNWVKKYKPEIYKKCEKRFFKNTIEIIALDEECLNKFFDLFNKYKNIKKED